MKLILLKDYKSLGQSGDIVEVKPGFARNFLIPNEIALRVTNKNLSVIEERKKFDLAREQREKSGFEEIAIKLSKTEITIEVQVGEEDKMFGSVSIKDIHKKILDKGIKISENSIVLDKPIKALGIYNIDIKLSLNIDSSVKVYVIKS